MGLYIYIGATYTPTALSCIVNSSAHCHWAESGIHPEITWAANFLLGASFMTHEEGNNE